MRRVAGLFGVVLATGAGTVAGAEACPRGPTALDTGVTVQFDELSVSFLRGADGRIHEVERYDDGGADWHYISDAIGLVFESWEVGPGGVVDESTRDRFSYDFPGGLPRGVPDGRFAGTESQRMASGEVYDTNVSWRMGPSETMQIGACSYSAIRIVETRIDLPKNAADPPWINHYTHLPELGLTLYLGGDEQGVDPILDQPRAVLAGVP